MTKQCIEKTISDIDYQKLSQDIFSPANIWNMSDDKSDKEDSIKNYYTEYSDKICFDRVQASLRNKSSEWLDFFELGLDSISLKCLENMKTIYQDENNVVLDENSVEKKPRINIETKSLELTI